MLRVCIDTNVWISGLIYSGLPARFLDIALTGEIEIISSSIILNELEKNLSKKYFNLQKNYVKELVYTVSELCSLYEPSGKIKIVKEKYSDNLVIETALLGHSQYLVTGDKKHLLPLKSYQSVKIVTVEQFFSLYKK